MANKFARVVLPPCSKETGFPHSRISLDDRAGYDYIVDYSRQPVPDFSEKDAVWADTLLREKRVR